MATKSRSSSTMGITADGTGVRSFDEFARQIELLATADEPASATTHWYGRRAATLARQAGACDQLITAALVHDFSVSVQPASDLADVQCTAKALAQLFPEQVVGPVRLLPCVAAAADGGVAAPPTSHGFAMARRLHHLVHQARAEPRGALLPIASLLQIARRVSLDDQ